MTNKKIMYNETKASFRYIGDSVDPQRITSTIGIQPSVAYFKGETVKKHPKHTHYTGLWAIDSLVQEDRPLVEHLQYLLDLLEPKAIEIRTLKDLGLSPNFYCGFFTSNDVAGIGVEVHILQRIVNIGASIDFRIYFDGD